MSDISNGESGDLSNEALHSGFAEAAFMERGAHLAEDAARAPRAPNLLSLEQTTQLLAEEEGGKRARAHV